MLEDKLRAVFSDIEVYKDHYSFAGWTSEFRIGALRFDYCLDRGDIYFHVRELDDPVETEIDLRDLAWLLSDGSHLDPPGDWLVQHAKIIKFLSEPGQLKGLKGELDQFALRYRSLTMPRLNWKERALRRLLGTPKFEGAGGLVRLQKELQKRTSADVTLSGEDLKLRDGNLRVKVSKSHVACNYNGKYDWLHLDLLLRYCGRHAPEMDVVGKVNWLLKLKAENPLVFSDSGWPQLCRTISGWDRVGKELRALL